MYDHMTIYGYNPDASISPDDKLQGPVCDPAANQGVLMVALSFGSYSTCSHLCSS